VLDYLHRIGATGVKLDETGLFADATIATGLAERLFATPLAQFRAQDGSRFVQPTGAGATNVRIPAPLRGLVTAVVGLDTRALAHAAAPSGSGYYPATGTQSGCPQGTATRGFTPNQYLSAYDFSPLQLGGLTGRGERVALIEIDGFKTSDLGTFARCFGLTIPPINGYGVGISHRLAPGGEATLDLEILDAAAPRLKAIDVYESRSSAASTLRALTAPLQNDRRRPQVVSVSLGLCEPFAYLAVGRRALSTVEGALAMGSAAGVTYLDASGDSGSADCTARDGTPVDRLAVNYPASSWWVTGVGGTNLVLDPANRIARQTVWNDAALVPGSAGGGGRSIIFKRPPYQTGTVTASHRAMPDVAMLSDLGPGYTIYCSTPDCVQKGIPRWQTIGGTSAATPLLAGGFALVDQLLRASGREPLGLVNPLLYAAGRSLAAGRVFRDVSTGSNDIGPYIGNGQPLGCCTAGPGYDEASGWGSVDLAQFAQLALATAPKIVHVAVSLPRHQRPLAARAIRATVSCSRPCTLAAYAVLTIGRARAFELKSRVYARSSAGRRTVELRFSARELRRLRAALARHQRVVATVFGVTLGGHRYIVRRSRGQSLRIMG
jgi:kumamolisin